MRQVWIVLRREYLERVKTKSFVLVTLLVPLLMLAMMGFMVFIAVQSQTDERDLVLVDLTGLYGEEVTERLEQAGYTAELAESGANLAEMDRQVLDDELEAYIVLDDLTTETGAFVYRAKESPSRVRGGLIRGFVIEAVIENRLSFADDATGVGAVLSGGQLSFEFVGQEGEEAETAEIRRASGMALGLVGTFFLYFTIIFYGAFVLRSVLDEKRNRVVEIVISSLKPWQLMLGKILGVGSVGLTQIGIWASFVLLLSLLGLPAAAAFWPTVEVEQITQFLPSAGMLLLLLAYFVLGYFLYSSLFAAVGAMCSREEEAAQAQFPVVLMLVAPFIMQMSSINGNSPVWMDWVALFPFFSPIMMYSRAVSGDAAPWMVALSLVLMVLAIFVTAWVAGRIYRVGILMQGKRPSVPELIRWVRAG